MENISSTAELQNAIQLLEAERSVKLILMKQNFRQAYKSVHPANLIQNTLNKILASPYLANNLLSAGVGIAAGYASKKAIVGRSSNKYKRFLGVILQLGITKLIAKNPKTIKAIGQVVSRVFHKEK